MSPKYAYCESCFRNVPAAPGHVFVSVPHVVADNGCTVTDAYKREHYGKPCPGNAERKLRDELIHVGTRLTEQYAILDNDAYWELP